jgi:hypothetical protein
MRREEDMILLQLVDKLLLGDERSIFLIPLEVGNIFEQAFDFGLLILLVEALISLPLDALGHRRSLRYIPLIDHLGKRPDDLGSLEEDILDVGVGWSLERSRRRLIILRGGNIRVRSPQGHTPDLDIRLEPVDFRGVVHVAEPSLLVDEALGFTVVVETTRDALPTIRKHLDSLGVPLLTPGSGGLVEKGDAFIPPLNQMLVGEGRVPVTLLGAEILSVEGVELGGEYETKDLRDRTLP